MVALFLQNNINNSVERFFYFFMVRLINRNNFSYSFKTH